DTDLFDESTIARALTHYKNLLEGFTANPERRIWELPLLDGVERRQLLVEWNDNARPYPQKCVHEVLAEIAAQFPDSVALAFKDREVTYRELDAESDRLAAHLRHLGVRRDVRVGITSDRSVGMAVGLLAILKAGGAYVPLDPSYPLERLEFLIDN